MITLTFNTTTITLPADLKWRDEFTWRPVSQSVEYSIAGAAIVQSASRTAGRPITLEGGQNFAVITRATLDVLNAWANVPGREMTLNIRGVDRTVIFRHDDAPAIDAEMILYHAQPSDDDLYRLIIKFMEV